MGRDTAWMNQGACAGMDPDDFFASKGRYTKVADAKAVCNQQCEVREECLDYALDHDIFYGVWGGTSPNERRRLLGKVVA